MPKLSQNFTENHQLNQFEGKIETNVDPMY